MNIEVKLDIIADRFQARELTSMQEGDVYRTICSAARIISECRAAGLIDEKGEVRTPLTFSQLAIANDRRAKQWNASGSSVPLIFALVEMAGEAGEACNIGKKLARTELGLAGGTSDVQPLVDEIADVVICCDLVARKVGFDLGQAVAAKFNATSRKRGFDVLLPETREEAHE